MPLKRHHKIIIGSAGSVIIVALIVCVVLLFIRQNMDYSLLSNQIGALESDTQAKLNDISSTLILTEQSLNNITSRVGSIDNTINLLKASASSDFSGIIGDAVKSVVTVKTDIAQGSGFLITNDGYIVTNEHVIDGATSAGVITYDGTTHAVKLIGADTTMDIALLKIEGNYNSIELEISKPQIGQKVIAIGNPLGLQFSVTEGIISGIDRQGSNGLNDYIQTDAALNPGNSGGPLINTNGKVVGINNFKIGGSENLGFALESKYIKQTVNQIYSQKYGGNLI